MDYAGWISAVTGLLVYEVVDANSADPTTTAAFNAIIPRAIDYTENRIQRDLDLVATTVTSTGRMAANSRLVGLPSVNLPSIDQIPDLVGTPIAPGSILTTTLGSLDVNVNWPDHGISAGEFVSILFPVQVGGLTLGGVFNAVVVIDVDNFTILGPTEATSAASITTVGNGIYVVAQQIRLIIGGRRQPPLEVVTRDSLDYFWPEDQGIAAGIYPTQWCPNDQTSVYVGPAPFTMLDFEALGTMRIPQLSSVNYSNFLTQFFPDLYIACSMVFFSGYQKDFGSQSDDPAHAVSWESQYQTLLASAKVEEIRKTFANMAPSPSNPSSIKAG